MGSVAPGWMVRRRASLPDPARAWRWAWATALAGWSQLGKSDSGQHALVQPIAPPDTATAHQLVTAPLSPSQSDFDTFFATHEHALYGYLRRMVPSDDVATELAQEAFFRAWRHFAEISAYERPASWLYRVATNLAISHLRRRHALPFTLLASRNERTGETENDPPAEELLPDPADFATQTAERDLINQVLLRLPERQRAALLLRAVQGLTCDEIAQALGMSGPAARQTLSRGRERFRTLYDEAQRDNDPSARPHPSH